MPVPPEPVPAPPEPTAAAPSTGAPAGAAPVPALPTRLRLQDFFTLRPYGRRLLTPAATVWLGSAWVVILLMASIEGFVWGAVGASLVPAGSPWLAPPVALFLFVLLFSVVWIVDASLIMSERPGLTRRRGLAAGEGGFGTWLRWWLGILVRIGIVGISLYVTAPFMEKLIRADDIAAWHQARVERYYEERARTLSAEVEARIARLEQGFTARAAALSADIARAAETLTAERERRTRLEAELAPEIAVLTRDLAEARGRVGDEVMGRDGRPEGFGPEARKWQARAEELAAQLQARQQELANRLGPTQDLITRLEQDLRARNETLEALRVEQQQLNERVAAEVAAEQPDAEPPKLSFAARSQALTALRESPDERGVPHFETVEGFAQAALAILFFSLLALKLFEPAAVSAYFSEAVQFGYQRYLDGGLRHLPGFGGHDDPRRRLSAVEFSRLWGRYLRDPEGWFEQHKALFAVEARAQRLAADREYEHELLNRRREGIDHELALEHRRREAELTARERELEVRLTQWGIRLADETRFRREREALDLDRTRLEAGRVADEAARAGRDERLGELQRARDAARDRRAELALQLQRVLEGRGGNADALAVNAARIAELTDTIATRREELARLNHELIGEPDQGGSGGGALGWLRIESDPRRRRLRRFRRRLEKALALDQQRLEALLGERAVLDLERERLDEITTGIRTEQAAVARRIGALERGIDSVMLADWRKDQWLMPSVGEGLDPDATGIPAGPDGGEDASDPDIRSRASAAEA